jgi:hypothetical protein
MAVVAVTALILPRQKVYNQRLDFLPSPGRGMEAQRMRGKRIWVIAAGLVAIAVVLPLVLGQQPPAEPVPPGPPAANTAQPPPTIDSGKLSLLEREIYLAGQRGAEWLQRANRPDGRFLYGYLPALRAPMEGGHYLQQVEATWALARAARFYRDDKAAAIARQALLTLLEETRLEKNSSNPKAEAVRYPAMPSALVNRAVAAGMLVLAIHELPGPASDLLQSSVELCNYLRSRQQSDGSIALDLENNSPAALETAAISYYTGPALAALMRGTSATWTTDAVRKAHGFYHPWWREHKNPGMIPWHTAAYAEAYLKLKEQALADTVFEMNDWLCALQYQQLDPRRPRWRGGFKSWREGREVAEFPEAASACYAMSLVHASTVAREAGDVRRWQRYKEAAELCLRFLMTLQYTDANTQHFAPWYRPALIGAFHASHEDGNLRLDYTSESVAAIVAYLDIRNALQ